MGATSFPRESDFQGKTLLGLSVFVRLRQLFGMKKEKAVFSRCILLGREKDL